MHKQFKLFHDLATIVYKKEHYEGFSSIVKVSPLLRTASLLNSVAILPLDSSKVLSTSRSFSNNPI